MHLKVFPWYIWNSSKHWFLNYIMHAIFISQHRGNIKSSALGKPILLFLLCLLMQFEFNFKKCIIILFLQILSKQQWFCFFFEQCNSNTNNNKPLTNWSNFLTVNMLCNINSYYTSKTTLLLPQLSLLHFCL